MVKSLISVNIIANCNFLINPLGLISDSEVNLFKYDVFPEVGVGKDGKILHANMPKSVTFGNVTAHIP